MKLGVYKTSQELRKAELENILKYIRDQDVNFRKNVFIAGDFNFGIAQESIIQAMSESNEEFSNILINLVNELII